MGVTEVVREGYGGWWITGLIVLGITGVWLAIFLYMRRYPRTAWDPGTEYVGWPWFVRWFSGVAALLLVLVVFGWSMSLSSAWDDAQKADATDDAGLSNVEYGYKEPDRFVATFEGELMFGYWSHIEGDTWNLVIGESK